MGKGLRGHALMKCYLTFIPDSEKKAFLCTRMIDNDAKNLLPAPVTVS